MDQSAIKTLMDPLDQRITMEMVVEQERKLFGCVLIALRIHKVLICDAMTSAEKWILLVASDDFKESDFHKGTP
jgi:hypothetical protein